ncbi:MAG: Phosphoglycerate mutase family protein [Candidatus Collierbacteria bacterium GW2011_GWC2_44_18]|uniref:Phosphoglycerate mutase family protein n=1 Tax=Candidatus Collierbacteria bacterium GW2011_GWC2_44_18 TaxID=1618392 RepID=A0A0G1K0G4_9BACT|nr:MAG: Phosphoglycerate mutase family protein [Candidatus Collierbacteria bacterium GW2011_GWC2_44_18]
MTKEAEWFLFRHGLGSASSRRQRLETQLGPQGRWQAYQGAQHKLSGHGIDRIFTSPLARAEETAGIIGEILGISPIIKQDLREMERPANIYGARHLSQHNLAYKEAWKAAFAKGDLDWKHEGQGESLRELIIRVDRLDRQMSNAYPGEKIVFVGHAIHLALFGAHKTLGKNTTPETIVELARDRFLKHGGLAHLRFEEGRWNLIHFDRSH